jgi:predicted phosphodiesterase
MCHMIAILSDVHSNFAALEAVVTDAQRQGASHYVFLGDAVGYHCEPNECIALLAEIDAVAIAGNHDTYALAGGECKRSRLVTATLRHNVSILTDASIQWLRSLPRTFSKADTLFVHGSPFETPEGYLYAVDASVFPEGVLRLFCGHTHVQALGRSSAGLTFCNPGSVGQPRDGDCRAAYALMNGDEIVMRRVEYDIDRTIAAMVSAGFASHHYDNLRQGAQIGGRIDSIVFSEDFR